ASPFVVLGERVHQHGRKPVAQPIEQDGDIDHEDANAEAKTSLVECDRPMWAILHSSGYVRRSSSLRCRAKLPTASERSGSRAPSAQASWEQSAQRASSGPSERAVRAQPPAPSLAQRPAS